jgi:hypothetical protein
MAMDLSQTKSDLRKMISCLLNFLDQENTPSIQVLLLNTLIKSPFPLTQLQLNMSFS